MSEEPTPLRLKPRLPSAGDSASPPAPPAAPPAAPPPPPPPPPPGATAASDQADVAGKLRLKPRLNVAEDPRPAAAEAPPAPEPAFPPPPPSARAAPMPEPAGAAGSPEDDVPKFKLRPKAAAPAPAPPPPPAASEPPSAPESFAPPPGIEEFAPPPPPAGIAPSASGTLPVPPIPARMSVSLPPMPVIAAPPPPSLGSVPEAPPPPGSAPRLSLSTPHEKTAAPKGGLHIKVAEGPKIGGKPVVKPGKPAPVLRKRPALGILAKAGIAVLIIAVAIGGIFSYRIFFPAPSQVISLKAPPIAKPIALTDAKPAAPDLAAKGAAEPGKGTGAGPGATVSTANGDQSKGGPAATVQEPVAPTPVPTPDKAATESVMAQSNLSTDVKVNNTRIDTSPAASGEFRLYVANAEIGGVFQGTPARALINGRIVKAGQVVDNQLGVVFDRIDADKKVIYFKDATGAEVSKEY